MKKFFGFGSSTPPPPSPPNKPPTPPAKPATPSVAATPAAPAKPSASAESAKQSPQSPPSIVGKWREPGSGDTTEFHADGRVTEKTANGETIRGRYSVRDKHLQIDLEGVPNQLSFPVAIAADKLEMSDDDGKITHYERVS